MNLITVISIVINILSTIYFLFLILVMIKNKFFTKLFSKIINYFINSFLKILSSRPSLQMGDNLKKSRYYVTGVVQIVLGTVFTYAFVMGYFLFFVMTAHNLNNMACSFNAVSIFEHVSCIIFNIVLNIKIYENTKILCLEEETDLDWS
jgi:hypothetical protein